MRQPPPVRTPRLPPPRPRPQATAARGPAAEQALRYGDHKLGAEALRGGEQGHRERVLQETIGRVDVHARDGRDGQRGGEVRRAGACARGAGYDYGSCVFGVEVRVVASVGRRRTDR